MAEIERQARRAPPSGGRLDQVLVGLFPEVSRSRLQQWIQSGQVWVSGELVTKSGMRLRGGEAILVRLPPPVSTDVLPEPIPLDVVYEDDDLLVINKAAGMVVHPSAGHDTGTLVNAVLAHAPNLAGVGGELRPGIVHRLDRDTSGLIVVAKNDRALRWLQGQFQSKAVDKTYLALVDGKPPARQGRIEAPIGRDPRHRQRMAVVSEAKGREAATEYRVQEAFAKHALLEAHPKTGRTHQIRLHLAFVGCPVVGDRVYGMRRPTLDAARQMLHAWRLGFRLPGGNEEREFEAEIPEDMERAIEQARGHSMEQGSEG